MRTTLLGMVFLGALTMTLAQGCSDEKSSSANSDCDWPPACCELLEFIQSVVEVVCVDYPDCSVCPQHGGFDLSGNTEEECQETLDTVTFDYMVDLWSTSCAMEQGRYRHWNRLRSLPRLHRLGRVLPEQRPLRLGAQRHLRLRLHVRLGCGGLRVVSSPFPALAARGRLSYFPPSMTTATGCDILGPPKGESHDTRDAPRDLDPVCIDADSRSGLR
jgi:hypothetical protein